MSFTGNEDHNIGLNDAADLTANYRATIAAGETIGEYFSKSYLASILAQNECVGIRVYYGLDTNGKKHLVISGVKANENDLHTGILAENGLKSPPLAGINNSLNS